MALKEWVSGSLWEMTNHAQVITMIGAGGKTTCLQSLTREIFAAGHPVIATTTTKVYPEGRMDPWYHSDPPPLQNGVYFWYTKVEEESGKWLGLSPAAVDRAIQHDFKHEAANCQEKTFKRYWVIEGDGARERRLKCWAQYEPQIPYSSKCGVLVLDGRLWGRKLEPSSIHRSERCADLVNRFFTEESAWIYFLQSPVFWKQYQELSWIILLNIPSRSILESYAYILEALQRRGLELQLGNFESGSRPRSLRLAAGDAKEGRLQWFDLW